MKKSLKVGLSFGLTSGVITTLGLLVGLAASTQSKLAVIGGILTIAIADSMSDSLGIHVSQETESAKNPKNLWLSAISTFISKFLTALTFVVPILYLDLFSAVIASIAWGLSVICVMSYVIAKSQKESPSHVILEHLSISIIVVLLSAGLGNIIANYFG